MVDYNLFVLLHSIMKKMRGIADRELAALGLGHAEMRILMAIYLHGELKQEELTAMLGVDASNVGRSLKKLEAGRYLARSRDERDGRANRIALTENGRDIRERLFQIRNDIRRTLTMGFLPGELDQLVDLLNKADSSLCDENHRLIRSSQPGEGD